MHDLLTDTLPTEWEGRAIDPDFRPMVWLLIRTRRVKTNEDSARLIASAIPLFFVEPIPVAQYPEAFESLVRFCQGGGPEYEERTGTGSSSDPQDEPVLDYRCDADYIVGAFQQAYGIDLTADKVHWWRFKALLHALPPETPLGKIVEIAERDPGQGHLQYGQGRPGLLRDPERALCPAGWAEGGEAERNPARARGRFPRPLRLIPAPRCPAPSAAERCQCGRLPRPTPTACG